jgi:hypothetical protein
MIFSVHGLVLRAKSLSRYPNVRFARRRTWLKGAGDARPMHPPATPAEQLPAYGLRLRTYSSLSGVCWAMVESLQLVPQLCGIIVVHKRPGPLNLQGDLHP